MLRSWTHLRNALLAILIAAAGLVVVTGSTASATEVCPNSGGWVKHDLAEGQTSDSLGDEELPDGVLSLSWNRDSIEYSLAAGYSLDLCLKAGQDGAGNDNPNSNAAVGGLETTTVTGSGNWDPEFRTDAQIAANRHEAGTSHIAYKVTPPTQGPSTIPLPTPGSSDDCGVAASWDTPYPVVDGVSWSLVNGELIATITKANTVFAGTGKSSNNFGAPQETKPGDCPVTVEEIELPEPSSSDACGVDATWDEQDTQDGLFSWSIVSGDLIVTITKANTVFKENGTNTYNFGAPEEKIEGPCDEEIDECDDDQVEDSNGDCVNQQVTFCHATNGGHYNLITTSVNAFFNAGHNNTDANHPMADIYPAFSYWKHGEKIDVPPQGDQTLLQYPNCDKPPTEIPLPTPTASDACGVAAAWTVPADVPGVMDWTLEEDGDLVATILAQDTVFAGTGKTTHNFGKARETVPGPCVMAVPATPQVVDLCGSGNAQWQVPGDVPGVLDWTLEQDGDLVATIVQAGTVFEGTDGATSYNFGKAPETNKEECGVDAEEIKVPATPGIFDPCGSGNATWQVPADVPGVLDWELNDDDHLVVSILAANTVFEGTNGATAYDFGIAPETNLEECEVGGVQLEVPAEPKMKDPCGKNNAAWVVPADTAQLDWTLDGDNLSVEILTPDTVFEGTQDTTFDFGAAEEANTKACEVKGEEEEEPEDDDPTIEVKGEQTAVPTSVNAGLGSEPATPVAVHRDSLWLVVMGLGLGLMGLAGTRRRKVANR